MEARREVEIHLERLCDKHRPSAELLYSKTLLAPELTAQLEEELASAMNGGCEDCSGVELMDIDVDAMWKRFQVRMVRSVLSQTFTPEEVEAGVATKEEIGKRVERWAEELTAQVGFVGSPPDKVGDALFVPTVQSLKKRE